MTNIALAGCTGKMGQALVRLAQESSRLALTGGLVRPGSESVGVDLGTLVGKPALGIQASGDLIQAFEQADVVVDFTLPEVMLSHLDYYLEHSKRLVIGSTGFDASQLKIIERASKDLPIVLAPNMSLGVNLCFSLVQKMAKLLKDYDVEIFEAHHRHKQDAPSGTALKLGEVIAQAKGLTLEQCANLNRHAQSQERSDNEIGFATMRGGTIFGDHTVMFAGEAERLELTHRAQSRDAFAQGALVACQWIAQQKPGLYDMQDVLGFNDLVA